MKTEETFNYLKQGKNISIGEGAEGAAAPLFSYIFKLFYDFALKITFNYKMLFNSIFRNVNLICITNTPTMLYAACPEK